jgi:hypothetical protein
MRSFVIEEDEMDRACSMNGGEINMYRLLVGKPEGKRPLGKPRLGWVDNVEMVLGEVEWCDVDWIGLAQDRGRWRALVNAVMNQKMLENYRITSQLVASRIGLSSIELVSSGLEWKVYMRRPAVVSMPSDIVSEVMRAQVCLTVSWARAQFLRLCCMFQCLGVSLLWMISSSGWMRWNISCSRQISVSWADTAAAKSLWTCFSSWMTIQMKYESAHLICQI